MQADGQDPVIFHSFCFGGIIIKYETSQPLNITAESYIRVCSVYQKRSPELSTKSKV